MTSLPTEEQQVVWEVLARIWVDTSYDAEDLEEFAHRLARGGLPLRKLDRIAHREVCSTPSGSWATLRVGGFFAQRGATFVRGSLNGSAHLPRRTGPYNLPVTPRHSLDREQARRDWERFVAANAHQFRAAGLPALAAQSIDHGDDLLAHGRFDFYDDPTHFEVRRLTEDQYLAFCALTESYFAAGYEFFPRCGLMMPRGSGHASGPDGWGCAMASLVSDAHIIRR